MDPNPWETKLHAFSCRERNCFKKLQVLVVNGNSTSRKCLQEGLCAILQAL